MLYTVNITIKKSVGLHESNESSPEYLDTMTSIDLGLTITTTKAKTNVLWRVSVLTPSPHAQTISANRPRKALPSPHQPPPSPSKKCQIYSLDNRDEVSHAVM